MNGNQQQLGGHAVPLAKAVIALDTKPIFGNVKDGTFMHLVYISLDYASCPWRGDYLLMIRSICGSASYRTVSDLTHMHLLCKILLSILLSMKCRD